MWHSALKEKKFRNLEKKNTLFYSFFSLLCLVDILKCLLRTIFLKKSVFSQKLKIREFVSKCCFPLKVCFLCTTDVFRKSKWNRMNFFLKKKALIPHTYSAAVLSSVNFPAAIYSRNSKIFWDKITSR